MELKKLFRILLQVQVVLALVVVLLIAAMFVNQRRINQSRERQFQADELADELRQSSDDLTRMARSYVASGNPEFEHEYWTVLGIRDGKLPRPVEYDQIYWDFVSATGQKPCPDGPPIAFRELLIKNGVTAAEFQKLDEAQQYSDALVATERIAMNAVKGLFADAAGNFTVQKEPDRAWALQLLFDEAYHQTKAKIMRPIAEFDVLLEARTAGVAALYRQRAVYLLSAASALICLLLAIFGLSFVLVERQIDCRERAEAARRTSEERLAEANATLERAVQQRTATLNDLVNDLEHFSYSIVHEMRAPLRAMRGFAELVLAQFGANPQLDRDYLKRIVDSAKQMDDLIKDTLIYSGTLRAEMPLGPVEPAALLQEMVATYPKFRAAVADISIDGPLPPVLANRAGLAQCFSNLLRNAIQFTPAGVRPQVRISAETRGDWVRLWIADNGIGIAPEFQTRMFQVFERTSRDAAGTGIGLALVHKIVAHMHGRVGVESELGHGSRFWIELPPAAAPAAAGG